MGKGIEKGQITDCNQSNTPLQYKSKDNALPRVSKGLAGCKIVSMQKRQKIAYKLGIMYQLVFSVKRNG
jgi:hypothetical protein